MARVWKREYYLVFHDAGVVLFFFLLPTMYPIVYTLIYNPEVITDMPVVVVDHNRSAASRHLARMVDATQAIEVWDYAPDMAAARKIMNSHDCFGILEIPANYDKRLNSGEQGVVTFYSDMSLLLRYRGLYSALTDVQMACGTEMRTEKIEGLGGASLEPAFEPINDQAVMLGDPAQGFASFIMPGIFILILQQSLLLGVTMLAAGCKERRRANGGVDPESIQAPIGAQMIGKMLCYISIYIPMVLYIIHIVPLMFNLPMIGSFGENCLIVFPLLIAAICFGFCLSWFVRERESSLLVIVFTSVIFLFLSGITWPRYAMNGFWKLLGDFVPATWCVEGFVKMNSNASPLWEQWQPYLMLWGLAILYFTVAYVLQKYCSLGQKKLQPEIRRQSH